MFPSHIFASKPPHLVYPSFTCSTLSGPGLHWRVAIWPVTWNKLHVPGVHHRPVRSRRLMVTLMTDYLWLWINIDYHILIPCWQDQLVLSSHAIVCQSVHSWNYLSSCDSLSFRHVTPTIARNHVHIGLCTLLHVRRVKYIIVTIIIVERRTLKDQIWIKKCVAHKSSSSRSERLECHGTQPKCP